MICINLITKTGNSLTKATQLFIYFRKKGKHVNILVMAALYCRVETVWVVSGYNESITINLNKITDMWNVGVA